MNEEVLLNALIAQEVNFEKLAAALQFKQRAIINNNIEGMEKSIHEEEILLNRINLAEMNRIGILNNLNQKMGLQNSLKLSDFTESAKNKISKKTLSEITGKQQSLKEQMLKINKLTQQNKFLIDHARNLLNETVHTILGENRKNILDRKI